MRLGGAERNLRFRHFLALKNAPGRNDLVQEKYLEMVKTISEAIVDAGIEPLSDEETLSFFDLVQVPVEITKIDLSIFRDLLSRLLDEDG